MNTVFEFRRCGIEHLDTVLDVESETLQSLERPDALRRNSLEMWRRVLQPPHYCLGAWVGEELAGFAVLYIPSGEDPDNLAAVLKNVDVRDYVPANYKICIVRPRWRGHHLQFQLGQLKIRGWRNMVLREYFFIKSINLCIFAASFIG